MATCCTTSTWCDAGTDSRNYIRTICSVCRRFIGYRKPDGEKWMAKKQASVLEPTDPNIHHSDRKSAIHQNEAILARLRDGPATNMDLLELAPKYTSRVSDLRKHGYTIDYDRKTKLYSLIAE